MNVCLFDIDGTLLDTGGAGQAAGRPRYAGAQAPVMVVMIRSTASSAMARTSSSLRF